MTCKIPSTVSENFLSGERSLLLVDAPNVDAVVGQLLGRAPRRTERFDPKALSDWAVGAVGGGPLDRTLFTNVTNPPRPGVEGWIASLMREGWSVYAKPKVRWNSDVDDAMVDHLVSQQWSGVIVFSHDARCFSELLSSLAADGVAVTVLGFREYAGRLPEVRGVTYVDCADVPGLYVSEPPRVRVSGVPDGGGWITRTVA